MRGNCTRAAQIEHVTSEFNFGEIAALEPQKESTLGNVYKILGIVGMLIAAVLWLAATQATANHADALAQQVSDRVENKADKQDIQRIYDKLDEINKYLRDRK